MDVTTSHILAKLDQIERALGETRREIIDTVSRTTHQTGDSGKERLPLLRLPPMGRMIAGGVVSWGIGRAIGEYLSRGGDPMALLEALVKLVL